MSNSKVFDKSEIELAKGFTAMMENEQNWAYLYPSLGLILKILKAEKKKYALGFVITPDKKTLTYSQSIDAFAAFLCKVLSNNSETVAIANYDFTTTYYALCYLVQVLESDYSHFKHFRAIADDETRIHFNDAFSLFKSFVQLTFKFE